MNKTWIKLVPVTDVPSEDVIAVEANGHEIALYGIEGQVFASDNICTHGHARLCDGFLDGHEIECPLHQGKFDIRSGKALCEPLTEDLRTYPVKVEEGYVFIEV
ncbi:non-heme iron oxygenase ferredoxin subunit [Crenobacter sp. SG2303]|uniref:Non-heme iron oxygenase ferredoxin subunit n=1 Tax=Crenobacter oryzisoli TaxID=3056844 RepID=A0ABT7XKM9_9NEIS|nr:non-heme iron oxygenase ferredoxin subunit [Crenobacter sp. SG2303]MDN0074331.1 non-heme iron oxygenase ferredoxin subunit [Crenobacter sp. SG2303]